MPRQASVGLKRSARFWAKVTKVEGTCWPWHAGLRNFGYGQFWYEGRSRPSHRFAYEDVVGPIPEGMCVLHKCDNPPCCNPSHLRLGTLAENSADMAVKRRSASGERNGGAKMRLEDVEVMRRMRNVDGLTQSEIARRYGLSQAHVSKIVRNESWI